MHSLFSRMNRVQIGWIITSVLLLTLMGCHPYTKEIPTGAAKVVDNVYSNPAYDHGKINNVFLLPLDNSMDNANVNRQNKEMVATLAAP